MTEAQNKANILRKLKDNMILFGKVVIPNMFSVNSPDFHYDIANYLMNKDEKQVNIIAPREHVYWKFM